MEKTKNLHPFWWITGFICAILGGITGTALGIYVAFGKYNKRDRIIGFIIIFISLIMTYLWILSLGKGKFIGLHPFI